MGRAKEPVLFLHLEKQTDKKKNRRDIVKNVLFQLVHQDMKY